MTTRLQIYQGALLLCAEGPLASLTENRETRHLLDLVWDDKGVDFCLEQAQWHFAMRAAQVDYDSSISPPWGFSRAFAKPSDWIATSGVFQDEFLRNPLTNYADEIQYWFADLDKIFVKIVSNGTDYGTDYANWPASFADYVKAYFASKIVHKTTGAATRTQFLMGPPGREDRGWLNRSLMIAKNKAAMTQPATFPSRGTWASARHQGNVGRNWDGGKINTLIG